MSDAALRAAERSYAQNPCEPGLLEALIRARRRLGLGGDHLLEVHSYSARQVSSRLKLRISVLALNGRELEVGTTGKTGVEVPAHRRLLVRPTPCKLDAALLVELREQGLEGISLERSRVSDEDLRLLADTPGLRWLSLRSCSQITNRALACLAEVAPRLEFLDLSGCHRTSAAGLRHLASLSHLRELQCQNRQWEDGDLIHLRALPNLRSLSLRGLKGAFGDGLAHLAPLERLTDLDLSNCRNLSGKRSLALPALPELRGLDLQWSWNLTDPALPMLARQPKLERLTLGTNRFTVAGLRSQQRLEQLRELRLFEVDEYRSGHLDPKQFRKFTDDALEWVASLPALEVLSLEQLSPWISDEGLAQLSGSKALRELWIFDCVALTRGGVEELHRRSPDLVIHYAGHDGQLAFGVEEASSNAEPQALLLPQVLGVLKLRRLHELAAEEDVPLSSKRTKAAAQEALAGVTLARVLAFMSREELAQACRRLKIKIDEYEGEEKLAQRIRSALDDTAR